MPINLLVAVPPEKTQRYTQNLANADQITLRIATSHKDVHNLLAMRDQPTDVLAVDNSLGDTYAMISELRQTYPRLLIVLIDEDADFGLPGKADDLTTTPFQDDDLVKRVKKLMSARMTETLRSDSLPAIRDFSRALRGAVGLGGKQQAAVDSAQSLGYDYVGYYHITNKDTLELQLRAQAGPRPIQAVAPKKATSDDLMTWVVQSRQSRIANYGDALNHPLVAKGRLGAVAAIPVMFDSRIFGVLVACRDRPESITQENVMMLELICSQFAAAMIKELN
ncbi:MAG: GAF domain-containing protein [Chloroflexi bacterium]|nr:MAG: GAF domain-containing protein [Chloroflexota bacterium]